MFTGIVQNYCPVVEIEKKPNLLSYAVRLPASATKGLKLGASISVDGVCQTVVQVKKTDVWFDAIPETLARTTLGDLVVGSEVNIERAAKIGDEIGGHLISGHIWGTAKIFKITAKDSIADLVFQCNPEWLPYLFHKGFIALDGVSLTLGQIDPKGYFTVHLIPETLQRTSLGRKKEGRQVNLEIDPQTQAIVDTVRRMKAQHV